MWINSSKWYGKCFSNGWTSLNDAADIHEPATNEILTRVAVANAADIKHAAQLASDAQKDWGRYNFLTRAEIFRKAAVLLKEEFAQCSDWIIRETGAIRPKAEFELSGVINLLHEAAGLCTQAKGILLPSDGYTSIAKRVPHGVVGIISPFNFPLLLSARSLLPALACGNSVVLKPDPRTPISGGFILAQLLEAAGLPENILHVLPGGADAGEALVCDPHVAMISFTGSTAAGRKVGELAGRNLKKVALELGGKNSLIILDDAPFEASLSCGAWASFLHQGQVCMSAGRHLVHQSLAKRYAEEMAAKANALPVGDPYREEVAIGPLITEEQAARVRDLIAQSVLAGATLLAGGKGEGPFVQPTVLTDVKPGMPVFEKEIFGPVVAITSFETDDEAIKLANATDYGLAAGVLTASLSRGLAIADKLNVGLVHVNDQTVNDDGFMPMGGRGKSGNGSRHGGPANLDEFTQWQWCTHRETPPTYPF